MYTSYHTTTIETIRECHKIIAIEELLGLLKTEQRTVVYILEEISKRLPILLIGDLKYFVGDLKCKKFENPCFKHTHVTFFSILALPAPSEKICGA